MKYSKPPLTIADQIEKLKQRGLIIKDENLGNRLLSNISYYRFRAYTYPYQDNTLPDHPFEDNVTLEDIMALYTFDRRLRILVFDAIERIEIALRTQIIHQMSLSHGSHWHLNQALYRNRTTFNHHLTLLDKEIHRSNETFIQHYQLKYTDPVEPPCWMSLEVSSISLLSMIFQNLRNGKEKKRITHHFGLMGVEIIENWMHNFCTVRNICAHHGRLWNRRIPIAIMIPKKTKNEYIQNKNISPFKLYASMSAMQYILSQITGKHL